MTRDYSSNSNFKPLAKIYGSDEWYHLSIQQKQQVHNIKSEQGWVNGQTPPHGFILDDNGYAKPSTHLVAAVQQSIIGRTDSTNTDMVQLPPPPQFIAPPIPPVINTDASQAGASFGRQGSRQRQDNNSSSNLSVVSINGQSYSGAIYDSRGNRLG